MELTTSPSVELAADPQRRLIEGLILEWGTVAPTGGRRWRFAVDSLYWTDVQRVKLNMHHERKELVGVATALWSTAQGLMGRFRVARIPEGDTALVMAADGVTDGFSVEVDFESPDDFGPDPTDRDVTLVRRGKLMGVAMTGTPAFDEARVTSVAASKDQMLNLRLDGDEADRVRAAAEMAETSVSELVRRQLRVYTTPRPVYSLDASSDTPSLVCDVWRRQNESYLGDATDARDRLAQHDRFMKEMRARITPATSADFAPQTTSTAPEIVPPGYRPLLADITADRPLFAASTRGELSDATPFTVPGALSDASVDSGAAVVAEGTNPTEGSMTFVPTTVTPTGVKGRFSVTRELVDSSNPAIDSIAFSAIREDYDRETETQLFTLLNTVQSGTITAGQVPSGAQARTSTGAALPVDLAKAILAFVEVRKHKARSVLASSRSAVAEALEPLDLTRFAFRDVTLELGPYITGTAAGDGDVFVLGSGDLRAWSSPLLDFRFFEKSGPALVELAIFGYFAAAVIEPAGVASLRHT